MYPDALRSAATRSWCLSGHPDRDTREDLMNSIHDLFRAHGLVRARDGRLLGGVIAGLGRRIGLDPWPARLRFILALLVIPEARSCCTRSCGS
jgi:hypothetical protein